MNRRQRRHQVALQRAVDTTIKLKCGQYSPRRAVLHVGCGAHASEIYARTFQGDEWVEVRLDIDPQVRPDIVASMTDLSMVESGAVDAVFSSHNLEHLFAHEVPEALREFVRVLSPTGIAVIGVPDLQRVAERVAQDQLCEQAYMSPAGPIAPIDMLYGHRGYVARGQIYMAHKTGFTAKTLAQTLVESGFARADVDRIEWDLWAVAHKSTMS
jgi:SAM-dependent methyltransferase